MPESVVDRIHRHAAGNPFLVEQLVDAAVVAGEIEPVGDLVRVHAITDAMHEHIGEPRTSVRVWINAFSNTDFMAGGELLADKQARLAAEAATAARANDATVPVPGQ